MCDKYSIRTASGNAMRAMNFVSHVSAEPTASCFTRPSATQCRHYCQWLSVRSRIFMIQEHLFLCLHSKYVRMLSKKKSIFCATFNLTTLCVSSVAGRYSIWNSYIYLWYLFIFQESQLTSNGTQIFSFLVRLIKEYQQPCHWCSAGECTFNAALIVLRFFTAWRNKRRVRLQP